MFDCVNRNLDNTGLPMFFDSLQGNILERVDSDDTGDGGAKEERKRNKVASLHRDRVKVNSSTECSRRGGIRFLCFLHNKRICRIALPIFSAYSYAN